MWPHSQPQGPSSGGSTASAWLGPREPPRLMGRRSARRLAVRARPSQGCTVRMGRCVSTTQVREETAWWTESSVETEKPLKAGGFVSAEKIRIHCKTTKFYQIFLVSRANILVELNWAKTNFQVTFQQNISYSNAPTFPHISFVLLQMY